MFKKSLSLIVIVCFFLTTLTPYPQAHADSILNLPTPGTMINLSPAYQPVIIKGLTVHKDNPFLFDFIVDVGQDNMSGAPLKKEGEKLIKYFLASLAVPDKDVWVNLSPYEKQRMVPEALGQTDMGKDLLEQDYILKQITASLIYPEKRLGKNFWDKVYAKAQQMYGTTQVPVNTFNKVWILADRAEVFEHNQTAFVVASHLKVMLEEDYLALQKHADIGAASTKAAVNTIGSQIVRSIILPELEKEVNTGKNFANLRQILNSLILANWYKKNLKEALLNQVYANQNKVKGINLNDPTVKQQIFEQYLKAYKKGVFNYIKEDVTAQGDTIPRKYFSGGFGEAAQVVNPAVTTDEAVLANALPDRAMVDINAGVLTEPFFGSKNVVTPDAAMNHMTPVAVPARFGEALTGVGLEAKGIRIRPVVEGKGDVNALLQNPLAQYILGSSSAAAIGSFPLRGRGKETPNKLDIKTAGDANALHFIEQATDLFISEHPQYAIVELASEGARDGSVSSPVGRIFHTSLGENHYVDTVEFEFDAKGKGKIKSFDKDKYVSTLDQLRAQGVTILFKVTDSLEKTEGLINKDALHNPTDSWALNSFIVDTGEGPYHLPIDDNFRTAGISYHALKKAEDLGPLDLPSVAIPKIAKANGIQLWIDESLPEEQRQITPEYKSFLQRVVMSTLGPRGFSLKDADSSDERHAAIIADGLRFMDEMQRKYGVELFNEQAGKDGMKMSPVTDGDLIVRLMALAGPVELNDNKIYIDFGRSGSAEAEAARAFSKTVPGAHMVSRRVSTTATAKNVSYATADNYNEEEIRINRVLGYDENAPTQVSYDEEKPARTIVAMTSVTGATNHLGNNFRDAMQRVREDAVNKTITTTTLISDEQGNMYVAEVEYASSLPTLTDTIQQVLKSDPRSRAVFEEMPELAPGDRAQRADVRADIKAAVPEIFGDQKVNGRQLNVENEIGRFTRMFAPVTRQLVSARALFRRQVANGTAVYGWPAPRIKFKDSDGNSLTFFQIVQGLIDNATGKPNPNAWRLNNEVPLNPEVLEPGMQGTGPIDSLDMLMNQINAAEDGATSWMADWEDAGNDWKDKLYQAWKNYKLVFNGTIAVGAVFEHPTKKDANGRPKQYTIKINRDKWPVFFARIPGLHLQNRQIMLDGKPVPGFIAALIINVLNNFDAQNGRLYHYIPKIETPGEALLLAQVLTALEKTIGVERGTLKIEMLNERARFTMNQPIIMWILRHWLIGTNVGRWDYINSLIEMHKDDPNAVFADPHTIGMTAAPLHAYTRLNAILMMLASLDKNHDMKNGMPLGGMSAFMSNGNPEVDARAVKAIGFDKMRERLTGLIKFRGRVYDGYRQSWVATVTPEYVRAGAKPLQESLEQLQAQVDLLTPDEQQRLIALKLLDKQGFITPYKLPSDLKVTDLFSPETFKELFSPIKGQITEVGLRYAIHMASEYMYQQQNGNNAAAIDDPLSGGRLMNDLATYEIFWHWIWTAVQHGAVITDDETNMPLLGTQLANFPEAQGKQRIAKGTVITADLIHRLIAEKQESGEAIIQQNGPGRFDPKKLPMVMNLLERQIRSKNWISYGSKVLYSILEVNDEIERQKIEDAIFEPTLNQLILEVNAGVYPRSVIEQYKEVYPEYADAAMVVFTYEANEGDTKEAIANRAGITVEQLALDNDLSRPLAGREIVIRTNARQFTYVVQKGDNIPSVSAKMGITVDQLAKTNHLVANEDLVPGERIQIVHPETDAAMLPSDFRSTLLANGIRNSVDLKRGRSGVDQQTRPQYLDKQEKLRRGAQNNVLPPSIRTSEGRFKRTSRSADSAQTAYGGIDLNTSNGMQWKVSKDGQGVETNIDSAMIARIRREGIDWLSPVIFKMTPVVSVWPLVGLQPPVEHLAKL